MNVRYVRMMHALDQLGDVWCPLIFHCGEAKASPSFHINMTLIIMRHRSHLVVFFLKSGISMTFHCPWLPHFLCSASNLSFVSCPMHAGLNHCNYSLMCGPTQNPITTLPSLIATLAIHAQFGTKLLRRLIVLRVFRSL
jgi:hypothetical protein